MLMDHHSRGFHSFRNRLSTVAVPFQYLVSKPIDLMSGFAASFSSHQALLKENSELKAQILLLNAELQKQYSIEAENQQLYALLQSNQQTKHLYMTVAQLLAVSTDPILREIVLDKGSQDGVYVGQPVIDSFGVMGQVVNVDPVTSRVMLINDSRSAIPVQIQRNGIRALAVGISQSQAILKLNNMAETEDVQVGDLVVTSGLGGRFTMGYPVGKVVAVRNNPNGSFADITVVPSARLNQSRLVLLLWLTEEKKPSAAAIATKSKKKSKGHSRNG